MALTPATITDFSEFGMFMEKSALWFCLQCFSPTLPQVFGALVRSNLLLLQLLVNYVAN